MKQAFKEGYFQTDLSKYFEKLGLSKLAGNGTGVAGGMGIWKITGKREETFQKLPLKPALAVRPILPNVLRISLAFFRPFILILCNKSIGLNLPIFE